MLKTLLFTSLFFFSLQSSFSQMLAIPQEVDSSFKSAYARAINSEWAVEGENFAVTFRVSNGQSVHIVYDSTGNVKEKYMALPRNTIPEQISKYLKENFAGIEVNNYWVKQKGMERIYKISFVNEFSGIGTIVGSAYGATDSTAIPSFETVSSAPQPELDDTHHLPPVYFDRFCNKIKSDEAMSDFFVAKKAKEEKPVAVEVSKNKRKRNFRK